MDTRFWGPSAWQLFHLITFEKGMLQSKKQLFTAMKDVLPCKYCRLSANEFFKEVPVDNNPAFWLYKFHDKVNQKLEKQHKEDPKVQKPIPSPLFDQVVEKYTALLRSNPITPPGHDFLLSIAFNYKPAIHKSANVAFWEELPKLFPFYKFRKHMRKPDLTNSETYFEDVHAMFVEMGDTESLHNAKVRISKFKSRCKRKTCRAGARVKRTLRRSRLLS